MMLKLATFARILRPSDRVEEAAKCNDEALVELKKEIVLAAPAAKDWPGSPRSCRPSAWPESAPKPRSDFSPPSAMRPPRLSPEDPTNDL